MDERSELVALASLLGQQHSEQLEDIELLSNIVSAVEGQKVAQQVDDSLAFPQDSGLGFDEDHSLWTRLDRLEGQLNKDYTNRRQMLLSRLECTVESFRKKRGSSDSVNRIEACYAKQKASLSREPNVSIAHLLAVRSSQGDKLLNGVVSSNKVDCKISYRNNQSRDASSSHAGLVSLKQIIIPDVPDRGGRTDEHKEPKKGFSDRERAGLRGHRGGRGGYHRGGRRRD